jgi:type I restriction enzyme M protein
MLGLIFSKALNKIQDPAELRRLIVDLINREKWMGLTADVKGDAFEGLLEKKRRIPKAAPGNSSRRAPSLTPLLIAFAPNPAKPSVTRRAARAAFFSPLMILSPTRRIISLTKCRKNSLNSKRYMASNLSTASPACAR